MLRRNNVVGTMTKREQQHATSKMLREKFDHFQT